VARPVFEARRIADRVNEQAVALRQFRLGVEHLQKPDQRVNAFRLVTVNSGEDADADRIVAGFGPMKR